MKKLHFFLILLFITIPCFAQAGEADLSSVQPTNDSNEFECLKETAPEYDDWVDWLRPECWCCQKQCRGDINCALFLGHPISLADLNILKAAFNQPDEVLRQNPELICADLNHKSFLGKRVTLADLNIFKYYIFKQREPLYAVPCCDLDGDCILTPEDKYNFWTN